MNLFTKRYDRNFPAFSPDDFAIIQRSTVSSCAPRKTSAAQRLRLLPPEFTPLTAALPSPYMMSF